LYVDGRFNLEEIKEMLIGKTYINEKVTLMGGCFSKSWFKKVLGSPNMVYEFISTKQLSHINMEYNPA